MPKHKGWGCGSVAGRLPSMQVALGSSPSTGGDGELSTS